MIKTTFTLLLSILSTISLFGQQSSIQIKDLEMKRYPADKDADAFVVYDLGNCHFEERSDQYVVIFERKTRIKIFSDAGIKWAQLEVPFYAHGDIYERISDLEANTYNYEDGKITRTALNLSNTYDEKINEYWNLRKFAMPDVKPGSIVEYHYKIESQYLFKLPSWKFQWKIPVQYSEYQTSMIPFYTYSYILQGGRDFDVFESYEDNKSQRIPMGASGKFFSEMVYKCGMKEIPAFKSEEFISSIDDYIMKLDFQLSEIHHMNGTVESILKTWDEMIHELNTHSNFGRFIKKSEKIGEKLLDIKGMSALNESEKLNQVVGYVKENFRWDKYNNNFASKTPSKLMSEKMGNCADLNLFTVGLLRAAGIDAKPVISSTRDHGKIKYDYPFDSFFNYVLILAKVDGKNLLTDATDNMVLNSRIPIRCINDKGLIVDEDGSVKWVGLESKAPSIHQRKYELKPDEDLGLNVTIEYLATEYEGIKLRKLIGENSDKIEKELAIDGFEFDASSAVIDNFNEKEKPFTIKFDQTGSMDMINSNIYINPFLNQTISENPLTDKTRDYPIDMVYSTINKFETSLKIPAGYKVKYTPEDLFYDNRVISMSYKTENVGENIKVSFSFFFKEPIYSPEDYIKLKYYFNEIVKKGTDKLVLVPTTDEASSSIE